MHGVFFMIVTELMRCDLCAMVMVTFVCIINGAPIVLETKENAQQRLAMTKNLAYFLMYVACPHGGSIIFEIGSQFWVLCLFECIAATSPS